MAYEIILRREGEDIARLPHAGSLNTASHLAEKLMRQRDADSARIIDVDGSGGEVWARNREVDETDDA